MGCEAKGTTACGMVVICADSTRYYTAACWLPVRGTQSVEVAGWELWCSWAAEGGS